MMRCCGAVLAVLLLPLAAHAQEPPPGTLRLTAEPPALLLGATPQVQVQVRAATPLDVAAVRLYASVGSMADLRAGEGGAVIATYSPPEAFYPQVAILAAVADTPQGVQVGWASLPLVGQGELSVPGAAGSEVSVAVGDKTFGPVVADASGQATIRVEVPPGIEEGVAGDSRVPIPTVPFSRLLLVPLASSLAVTEAASLELRVFAIDARGAPAPQATLKFKATQGTAGGVEKLEDGVYRVRFTPRPKTAGKSANITVNLVGHKPSASIAQVALRSPTQPARLELVCVPPTAVPSAKVMVVARVLDEAGQPAPGVPTLQVDRGQLDTPQEVAPGQFQSTLELPDWAGDVTLSARLDVEGGEALQQTLALSVQEPSVATTADTTEDQAELATAGVTSQVDQSPAPLSLTLGLSAGFESNFVALWAPALALDVTLLGRGVLDGLALRLELGGLYQYGETELSSGPLQGRTFTRHTVAAPLSLQLDYRLRLVDTLALFGGVGGSVGYLLSTLDDSAAHQLTLAALVQLGVAWGLGPGELVVKLRYLYGGLEQPWGGAAILAGYSITLL